MALMGTAIDKKQLQPGDLVFFNTLGRRYSHVGIYLGDNRFVHSPSSGGVVRIEKMTLASWAKRYNGASRLEGGLLPSAPGEAVPRSTWRRVGNAGVRTCISRLSLSPISTKYHTHAL